MAIKCADLGHLAAEWDVHRRWVSVLEEEFFLQVPRHAQQSVRQHCLLHVYLSTVCLSAPQCVLSVSPAITN